MLKKLIITGSGIKSLSHVTRETETAIAQASFVLYLVNEPIMAQWIQNKSQKSESLDDIYFSEKLRVDAYKKIVERVMFILNQHSHVCVVVYGHPLLLSNSITHLIQCIDRTVVELSILPAISSFDCLLADMEIDPFSGCYSIEVNELINKDKFIDTSAHVIIWQVGIVNDIYTDITIDNTAGMRMLKEKLLRSYDSGHECIFYEASIYPHIPAKKTNINMSTINQVPVSRITTLYIPPIVEKKSFIHVPLAKIT